jgi:glucose-6-phosphate 1-dehydrogenase
MEKPLEIVVVGASGDLAGKKIFPALFSLFCQGLLPEDVSFIGFARSGFTDAEFRERISRTLTCRYTPGKDSCAGKTEDFLSRTSYRQGKYGDPESYAAMKDALPSDSNKIFYLSIPPSVFAETAEALGASGLAGTAGESWTRIVVEKPFGKDRSGFDELNSALSAVFPESWIYRIDHYLGKEMVRNIQVLRFANEIFKPVWNSHHIARVEISWAEDIGVEGRGGYFDNYGIIRDVMQNHLLQMLALIAMEPPPTLDAADIRNRKVELLRAIPPIRPEDAVIGQYTAGKLNGVGHPGYREDPTVPDDSRTPTFAGITLEVNNERWEDTEFAITAGKALDKRESSIRIVFKTSKHNLFCSLGVCPMPNELVVRIQPNEGVTLKISTKAPGAEMSFHTKELDLAYSKVFSGDIIPEAYENLILDVVKGDKSLFIRDDELQAAWDIFTPLLHHLEENEVEPVPYSFGTFPRI